MHTGVSARKGRIWERSVGALMIVSSESRAKELRAKFLSSRLRSAVAVAAVIVAAGFLGACQDSEGLGSARAYRPIPAATVALMQQKGMTKHSPILLRAFKKEAELEIWKMKSDGEYALLKTYPMCRWSGQLGPKRREGDRQVPEGFYAITPSQMNPNSNYYLSFNVGYPNAYDRAHGGTGSLIMVHGACSSAGCFSMTDEQIAEIYAIAREAFGGGQAAIQMQSMPFRMTPENLAKHRFDPNMKFWRNLKEGSDHFEVAKREPKVAVCGKKYVFDSTPANASARLDPRGACPQLKQDEGLKHAVAAKNHRDQQKVAELVSKGMQAIKVVYADGGQHPSFNHVTLVSRPDAIAKGPVEVAIDEKGKPIKTPVKVAAKPVKTETAIAAAKPAPASPAASGTTAVARNNGSKESLGAAANVKLPATATAFAPAPAAAPAASADQPFYKRWLGLTSSQQPAAQPEPQAETPAPTPPKRAESSPARKRSAKSEKQASALPGVIQGSHPVLPQGLMAYAPQDR